MQRHFEQLMSFALILYIKSTSDTSVKCCIVAFPSVRYVGMRRWMISHVMSSTGTMLIVLKADFIARSLYESLGRKWLYCLVFMYD